MAVTALFALFDQPDICLSPSLYEPFSLTLILALACGIPTAASRAGGNVEIVRDRQTGVLFERGNPADLARAVRALASDPDLRRLIASTGREFAGGSTFEAMVARRGRFLASVRRHA